MASNYFAEVGKFFLNGGEYTKLQSNGVNTADFKFQQGEIYGARLRLKTSYSGSRTYNFESGSDGTNNFYGAFGAKAIQSIPFGSRMPTGSTVGSAYPTLIASNLANSGTYELPQDPTQNPEFSKNFTMYSRTTAFGPPILGRKYSDSAVSSTNYRYSLAATSSANFGTKDSLNGFNWSFTPPYYDGEAWVDFVFIPTASVNYDLNRILKETKIVPRRFDPGDSLLRTATGDPSHAGFRTLVKDRLFSDVSKDPTGFGGLTNQSYKGFEIYAGENINSNAMQINASINLFGVENVPKTTFDKFGQLVQDENEIASKRWVIQPKFETPMMNFHDTGARPISADEGTLTLPQNFGSESVPRGMWHQFGTIPEDANKGIFLEIGEIPQPWLRNHYEVVGSSSIYNDFNGLVGPAIHQSYKSFADLMGFTNENSRVRLGELANRQTIKEAVVAVPYVIKNTATVASEAFASDLPQNSSKQFISIPQIRYEAALSQNAGSAVGNSLDAAGKSIRNQINKMRQFVLPPQFDFINNTEIDPMVMYIFDFKYELDKNDLSYIWQNLAPRNSRKISLSEDAVAHELINTELLTEDNLVNNPNLRWMVFKVKQRSQALYEDIVVKQVDQSIKPPQLLGPQRQDGQDANTQGYKVRFNWPYDYVSIIETVKLDVDLLYKKDNEQVPVNFVTQPPQTPNGQAPGAPSILRQDINGDSFFGQDLAANGGKQVSPSKTLIGPKGKVNQALDKSQRKKKYFTQTAKKTTK